MRIILCDDDTQFMQSFSKQLFPIFKKHGIIPQIIPTHTSLDALREITRQPTDVLFLDIDMPQQDGFSVANELSAMANKPLIIFLSSLDHLVYQSFAFQPFWFLRKMHLEDLPTVIEKLLHLLSAQQVQYTININGSNTCISLLDILYFESDGHYIIAYTRTKPIRFKARMSDLESELNKYSFIRCHIGFLVNCRFIKICNRTSITLITDQTIPVSRAKADEVQNIFMTYMRSLRP